jgi:uncharacterized protein YjdB
LVSYDNNDVCAFTKTSGTEKVVVFSNLRNSTINYTIPSAIANTTWTDAFSGATVTLGTSLSLTAYQYRVLTNANVPVVPVTGVTVSPATASIHAGATTQLTATVAPANATNPAVNWTSGNTAVATVSASGLVTAVAAGTTVITATTADQGKASTATITVTPAATFTVNFYRPSTWGTGIRIYWWSAQPAGVLADGTWPGVSMTNLGTGWYSYTFTNVTSTNLIFNDGTNQTANLSRSTTGWYLNNTWYDTNPGTPVPVTGVTVSPTTATVTIGATSQLTATIAPSNATNTVVTWTSGNTSVATVSSTGLVTAVASGTATITVTTQDGGKTATCAITVPSAGTTYYQILNRWQANTYLYDGGNGQVKYGINPASTNYAYQWAQVNIGGGFIQLQNRSTGNYMFVENQTGAVQCGAINQSWYSAMWTINATGDGWNYIKNRWQTSEWIHIENLLGYAQYSNPQTGWYSAMWQFVNPATARMITNPVITQSDSITSSIVQLYPNPVQGRQFHVLVPGLLQNELAQVVVSDNTGKVVLVTQVASGGLVEHHLPAGLYLVSIRTRHNTVTKKLVVQ